jgi:hypothetical protein
MDPVFYFTSHGKKLIKLCKYDYSNHTISNCNEAPKILEDSFEDKNTRYLFQKNVFEKYPNETKIIKDYLSEKNIIFQMEDTILTSKGEILYYIYSR